MCVCVCKEGRRSSLERGNRTSTKARRVSPASELVPICAIEDFPKRFLLLVCVCVCVRGCVFLFFVFFVNDFTTMEWPLKCNQEPWVSH